MNGRSQGSGNSADHLSPSTRGQKTRDRLFDVFSSGYEAWTKRPNLVACPICLREYGRDDLESRRLELGHVLPRALGASNAQVLLCSTCNRRNGKLLDKHLVDVHRSFGHGRSLERGERIWRLRLGGSSCLVAVRGAAVLDVRLIDSGGAAQASFGQLMRQAAIGHLRLSLQDYGSIERARVALLSAAYLSLFATVGYAPVFTPSFDRIRQQLMAPATSMVPYAVTSDFAPNFKTGFEFAFATEPPSYRCIVVRALSSFVILPVASEPGDGVYDNIARLGAWSIAGPTIQLRKLVLPDLLVSRQHRPVTKPTSAWITDKVTGERTYYVGGPSAVQRARAA